MIQELIYQKFGVLYSVKYLSELLKNLGFSYQKARFAVGGKDPENILKRKVWLGIHGRKSLKKPATECISPVR